MEVWGVPYATLKLVHNELPETQQLVEFYHGIVFRGWLLLLESALRSPNYLYLPVSLILGAALYPKLIQKLPNQF